MANHEVITTWTGDMAFEAEVSGHKIRIDAAPDVGGHDSGPRPKPLVLVSVAGCTGMDVVSLLKKMRQPLSWFDLKVDGELTEEHPVSYKSIEIVYRFKESDGLEKDKVEKAVNLSQDRYCGVSALLKKAIPVTWRIEYL
ncbi:MAG TPA: OsmC family protein [Rectinemataceae bacterium]|nr:OsmC family protein [Rectinemataceae bacterium]